MVNYNIAIPQQQLFQAPDFTQNAMRMQQMQAQDMQMQQAQRAQQQQNAMAAHLSGGGDMSTPEFRRQLLAVGGASAAPILASIATMEREKSQQLAEQSRANRYASQARTSDFDLQVNKRKDFLNRAPAAMVSDEAWAKYVDDSVKEFGPNITLSRTRPSEKDLIAFLSSGADKIRQVEAEAKAAQDATKLTPHVTDAGVLFTNPKGGYQMGTELLQSGAPAAGAPAVGGAPMGGAGAPAMPGGEAGYLTGLNRAEGTAKNPYSSADGKFQFINSTFVDTARKVYPGLADSSPAQILSLRGKKLDGGAQIEDVLEQRLRADNTQALTSAGIAPTPGNTYLAHFLGAGGARSLLSVDPNTPVSQILDPRAIAANKSVLEGKTAGQVAAWADSKFGGPPGLAASMTAGNQRQAGVGAPSFTPAMGGGMSPTAPTVNNAMVLDLMGQQPPQQGNALAMQAAPMLQQPSVPVTTAPAQVGPAPSALSPYQQGMADAEQRKLKAKLAEERGKADIEKETQARTRQETAGRVLQVLNDPKIDEMIKNSTSGVVQNIFSAVPGAFGQGTTGKENIGRLNTTQESLLFRLANGKLGGGFTEKDAETIRGMLGRIADPNTAANIRLQTLQDVRSFMQSEASGNPIALQPVTTDEPKPSARRNLKTGDTGTKKPDSFAHFMSVVKEQNPNVSDSALKAYYDKTYGGR
jgi:hypothetical protein